MSYVTSAEIIARLGEDVVLRLAATAEGAVDTAKVQQAIDEAEGEVNSYVMQRYAVPVSPVPAVLKKVCRDLAVFQLFLWRGYDPEKDREVELGRKAAIEWLHRLALGTASLGAMLRSWTGLLPRATEWRLLGRRHAPISFSKMACMV